MPEITLTEFSKFNQVELNSRALDEMAELVLDYQDSVIGFKFVALDFTAPLKNQFRYRLKGFDLDWVDLVGEHQTTYTNLDPGDYEFEVIGSNNDLVWNDRGASIRITVLPPPWLALRLCKQITHAFFFALIRVRCIRIISRVNTHFGQKIRNGKKI